MKTVTSLELSKQLKEAGFPQHKSHFVWGVWGVNKFNYDIEIPKEKQEPELFTNDDQFGEGVARIADAPLAEEILERLPISVVSNLEDGKEHEYDITFQRLHTNQWIVALDCFMDYGAGVLHTETDESFCAALAKMWLYLKENNLLPEPPSSDKGGGQ